MSETNSSSSAIESRPSETHSSKSSKNSLDHLANQSKPYVEMIEGLHKLWRPHQGQIKVGKALVNDGVLDVMVEAGRNWGKTELVSYLLWRWAKENPGSENYYFAPYMKQAREILWATNRIQNFGPRSWLSKSPNNTDMRLNFNNGSFIKLDGSDNVESYRGVKPRGLSVFDEFKDFRPEFYDAYDPNRAAYNSPLLIIGTPPDRECQFTQVAEDFRRQSTKRYFWAPTEENPHISRDWLAKKKSELYAKGEGDKWEREYMARFVKGGAAKIFPMFSKEVVVPHETLVREIHRDRKKLEWIMFSDPAAASCFAVLFVAVNPYNKKIYCLDELYELEQGQMSVRKIGPRMFKKRDELWDREWRQGYDEAETWFANEMLDYYEEHFEPSHKHLNDKETGISLIRDILIGGNLVMSDRCQKLFWEMDNYFKDQNGRIPKKDDHLIDCLRYVLGALNYKLKEDIEYIERDDPNFRGARPEDDFPSLKNMDEDWGVGPLWDE